MPSGFLQVYSKWFDLLASSTNHHHLLYAERCGQVTQLAVSEHAHRRDYLMVPSSLIRRMSIKATESSGRLLYSLLPHLKRNEIDRGKHIFFCNFNFICWNNIFLMRIDCLLPFPVGWTGRWCCPLDLFGQPLHAPTCRPSVVLINALHHLQHSHLLRPSHPAANWGLSQCCSCSSCAQQHHRVRRWLISKRGRRPGPWPAPNSNSI